jgi:cobalt-zinc-cadmium efflux system membrane fusion protein
MKVMVLVRAASFSLVALSTLAIGGCGGGGVKGPEAGTQATPATDSSAIAVDWCVEHGVPESICGQCNAKLAADFKQKGDWCKEHNRPESQCFLCNPKRKAKFAAAYEAKYGKKPPEPEVK